jgi:Putative zinc- or iron-chelating domain
VRLPIVKLSTIRNAVDVEHSSIVEQTMNVAESAHTLCLSCGFCCDGTLFGSVPLAAADARASLQADGIEIHTAADETFFMQPCHAHRQGGCQVYEDRPVNCRQYRCELLKKFERRALSWDEAQRQIERVRALKEALTADLARIVPDAGRWSIISWMTRVPTQRQLAADPELLSTWAPVMVRVAALLDTLQRHFRSPRPPGDQSGAEARLPREVDS